LSLILGRTGPTFFSHRKPKSKKKTSVGICFGKFSNTGKFRLHITALGLIANHALYKVWLKPSGEQNFVYGNHALKAHIARMTENTPKYSGIIVCSANDVPIGFGVLGRDTNELKMLDPTTIVIFNQADVGEYLRNEDLQITNVSEN
jgi:60S ribosome subunit biogenesis protein NIP7